MMMISIGREMTNLVFQPDRKLLRPTLHHLGHLPVRLLVLLHLLQWSPLHTCMIPICHPFFKSCTIFGSRKEKLYPTYIIWRHCWWLLVICGSPPDHHLLLSWPDWCQPQVHLLLEKSLNFWMCFPPRMYSDGSVTKKGWSINWVAIPDWSTHETD